MNRIPKLVIGLALCLGAAAMHFHWTISLWFAIPVFLLGLMGLASSALPDLF